MLQHISLPPESIDAGFLDNTGGIKADKDVAITADNVLNRQGAIEGETVAVTADGSIANQSATIQGKNVTLAAGENVVVETRVDQTLTAPDGGPSNFSHGYIHKEGAVSADEDLTITAGGQVAIQGGVFNSLNEVRAVTEGFIREYNEERPHESLGNMTPIDFAP